MQQRRAQLPRIPFSSGDYRSRRLALPSLLPQLPRRRRSPCPTGNHRARMNGSRRARSCRSARRRRAPTRRFSTANVSRHGPRSSARDRTILAVKEIGRRRWKKTLGYHGQARVENAFFRYTSIIGDSLRACSPTGRGTEVDLACNILNQMTVLGRWPPRRRAGRVGTGESDTWSARRPARPVRPFLRFLTGRRTLLISAPFSRGVMFVMATSSNHRVWSRFNSQLSLAHTR